MKKNAFMITRAALDMVIAIFVSLSMIWMFNQPTGDGWNKAEYLRLYTVLSNLLVGITALIAIYFDFKSMLGDLPSPRRIKTLYVGASSCTTVTMLTVIFFLGPTMGFQFMYNDHNLFMHLLTPLVALVRVLLFEEKEKPMQFKDTFPCAIPTFLYGLYYLINCASHNGYGTLDYDWYGFGAAGLGVGILSFLLMVGVTYGIAWAIWFGQKKIHLY